MPKQKPAAGLALADQLPRAHLTLCFGCVILKNTAGWLSHLQHLPQSYYEAGGFVSQPACILNVATTLYNLPIQPADAGAIYVKQKCTVI